MLRSFCLLCLCFVLANCTTISVKLPGATIESPEVAGKGKKQIGPSMEPARGVEYSDSLSSRPPDLENAQELGTTHTMLHHARFGLGDRFELGGQVGVDLSSDIQSTFMLVGKYQIFGPTKEKAKAGDASAEIHARFAYLSADGSGDQDEVFGAGGFPWTAKVTSYLTMVGASFSYRMADSVLLYFGGSYQDVKSSVEVSQSPAEDNSDPGGSFQRNRNGRSLAYGMGLQVRLGRVFYFHGKLFQHEFTLDGIPDHETLFGGGGFHFYF